MNDCISEAYAITEGADYIEQEGLFFKDTSKPKKRVGKQTAYKCTRCGQYKPKSAFYADKRNPCGIRSRCKICYHKKEGDKE